jgi:hypothetical protein
MVALVEKTEHLGLGAPCPGDIGNDSIGAIHGTVLMLRDRVELGCRLVASENQKNGGD